MTYHAMTCGAGGLWRPRGVVATGYSAAPLPTAEENPEGSSQKSKQLLLFGGLGILAVVAGVVVLKKGK